MNYKPVMCGEALFDIERKRYDELVAAETRLKLLENAIRANDSYGLNEIKNVFGLYKAVNENEN